MAESNEPRWGYFGCSGSLAIGDNSYAPPKLRKPKDDEPAEPMPQIQCNPMKKGAATDIYFKFETSVNLGDPYQDPGTATKKGKVKMLDPDAAFRPPGKVRYAINKLGYEYVDHEASTKDAKDVKEKYKDYMPPKQILSNPAKKGGGGVLTPGVLFGMTEDRKFPEHMEDDYNAPRKLRLKELEEHRAKLQEMPFKGMEHGHKPFHPTGDVYHYDAPTHVPREPKTDSNVLKYAHENPFKPSNPTKKGVPNGLLGGFPEYIEDPIKAPTRRAPPADGEEKAPFKGCVPGKFTNPMPSVVTMTRNMRSERPSSFVRPSL